MEVLYPRCVALDVHKDTVVAAIRLAESGEVHREVRTFATTTPALLDLSAWLDEHGCTHVAMEATGIYWRPVWQVLDADSRTLTVTQNPNPAAPPPGFVAVEPVSFIVIVAEGTQGLTLQKVDYILNKNSEYLPLFHLAHSG